MKLSICYMISYTWYLLLDISYLISGTRYLVSNTWYLMVLSENWHLINDIWYFISDILYLILDIWFYIKKNSWCSIFRAFGFCGSHNSLLVCSTEAFKVHIYIWEKTENPASPPLLSKSLNFEFWTFWFSAQIPPPHTFGLFPLFVTFFNWHAPLGWCPTYRPAWVMPYGQHKSRPYIRHENCIVGFRKHFC